MTEKQNVFIKLHLSVLLAGFTGLFGKLITLNEVNIVWYRMFFASVFLLLLKGLPKVTSRKLLHLSLAGALLGFHWVLFYSSIKLSNISIGVICYSLVGFFTALIEPAVFHKRVSFLEILFSLITVLGLLCIFSFDSRYRLGISVGVVSSFVAALYGTLNKKISADVSSSTTLLYSMMGGLVFLSCIIPLYLLVFPSSQPVIVFPQGNNLYWLLCLSLVCTVGLYLLQIQSLKHLSAFTVNLTYNLEPCYTILIAFLFFNEAHELNFSFYIGVSLIIISVMLQTWRASRK
jgi:drug/metabolite transporter (DMT)-like permease